MHRGRQRPIVKVVRREGNGRDAEVVLQCGHTAFVKDSTRKNGYCVQCIGGETDLTP